MTDQAHEYKVSGLRSGTVIDHLSPGTALKAHRALRLPATALVTIGINLESKKLGHKDIIKIENVELAKNELNKLALISPRATLAIIRDYQVAEKFEIEMPEEVVGIAGCANPSCITASEAVETRFRITQQSPVLLRCHFCERVMSPDDLEILR